MLREKGIDKRYIYNGDDIKDDISEQAEKSNKEVLSERLKEWKNDYFELKNNSPALFIARDLMVNMLIGKNVKD